MTEDEIRVARQHFVHGITHDIYKEPVLTYAKTAVLAFDKIEGLQAISDAEFDINHDLANDIAMVVERIQKRILEAQIDAVKCFAERLKAKAEYFCDEKESFVAEEYIDNLVAEMTEGGDE